MDEVKGSREPAPVVRGRTETIFELQNPKGRITVTLEGEPKVELFNRVRDDVVAHLNGACPCPRPYAFSNREKTNGDDE